MAAARVQCSKVAHTPERFGDYLVLGKLAAGGMAEVHLACGLSGALAGKPVALKRMLPYLSEQQRFVDMFLSEAVITSRIDHDNVCRIYDYGEVDGTYFIAMEYLHGGSLGALLTKLSKRGRRLKLRFASALFGGVCEGLQAAHELGIIHRDVSPNNIFITTAGEVKLLDFGVAKASFVSTNTRTGVVKGTFAYMSPEQLEGRTLDSRADLFSLGAVLHEALTCRRLFKRDNDYDTCRAITREPIPRVCDLRSSVPAGLSNAIERALARRRQDRYASAAELGEAILAALETHGQQPDRAAIGAEIARLFDSELERIDDLVAEQPTRVMLSRPPAVAHPVPSRPRHDRGDIIAALPLRSKSAHDAARLDESHPTGAVSRIEDTDPEDVVPGEAAAEPTERKLAMEMPRRRVGRSRRSGLAAVLVAVGLLVLDGSSGEPAASRAPVEARAATPRVEPAASVSASTAAPVIEPNDAAATVEDEPVTPVIEGIIEPALVDGEPALVGGESAPVDGEPAPVDGEPANAARGTAVATPAVASKRSHKRRVRRRSASRNDAVAGPGARIAAEL